MTNTIKDRSAGASATKISEANEIIEYRLENGLKVLLLENHNAPVATILVLFKVGSRNEAVGFTGATHFLEHMLFKGTEKHNADKGNGIDDLLTQIGAYWNATTWFDRTSYFEVVPAEYLDMCVELEADRMRNLLLRQEDHDSEMSVVRNEFERGENHPEEALEKELYALAFREHPYHHPTIGWRSDVEGVSMLKLKEFYDTFYWPDNATLVLVGDFKSEEALASVSKHFGQIQSAPHPIPQVYTSEPPQEGERRFEVRRAGDLPRVWIGFHVPQASHDDNYPLAAIRHILGGTYERASRLYQSLIDSGIASDAFARHHDLKDPSLFIVGATLNPGVDPEKAEAILHEELAKLANEPVSETELKRAKTANWKGTVLAKADPSSLAFMLGEAESKADWHWLMNYDDRFNAVTAEAIERVAKRYFVKNNRTVGYFFPEQQELVDIAYDQPETAPAETKAFNQSQSAATIKHKELPSTLKEILALSPPVVKIQVPRPKAPSTKYEAKVERHVLSNGLTLLLMPSLGTQSLGIAGITKAGKFFSHNKNANLADLTVDLLPKGSLRFSKMAIAEILENMGVSSALDFSIDNFRVGFGTKLVSSDLDEFCPLLADVLLHPQFDPVELAKTKVEWQAKYAEAMHSTRMLATSRLRRELYPKGHPFHEASFEEQLAELDSVTIEEIRTLHQALFQPGGTVISIVGDIDSAKTVDLFERSFAQWAKGTAGSIVIPDAVAVAKQAEITINLPDKRSADIIIGHATSLKRTNQDFYAARIANAALGQDTLTSRLGQIIREKAGLTYGIYSSFSDSAFGNAPWTVSLSVNPVNKERALKLVNEVLADYVSNGISEEELSRETGRALGSFKVGLASSLGIAKVLSEFEFLGLPLSELDKIADRYNSVTKADADKAMHRYIHPDQAVTIVAGTF
jgi:zinc protease